MDLKQAKAQANQNSFYGMNFKNQNSNNFLKESKKDVPRSLIKLCIGMLQDQLNKKRFLRQGCSFRMPGWKTNAFVQRRKKLGLSKDACAPFWKKLTRNDHTKWCKVLDNAKPMKFFGFGRRKAKVPTVPIQPAEDGWSLPRSA